MAYIGFVDWLYKADLISPCPSLDYSFPSSAFLLGKKSLLNALEALSITY